MDHGTKPRTWFIDVRKHRINAKLTQMELSAIIKVPQGTISTWEVDGVSPRADVIPELARAFGIPISGLFDQR